MTRVKSYCVCWGLAITLLHPSLAWTVWSLSSRHQPPPACSRLWSRSSSSAPAAEDPVHDDDDIDVNAVSEAEALLACRAYLQRKKRLGKWTDQEERRRRAERAIPRMNQAARGASGFFWENPAELKYWREVSSISDEPVLDHELEDTFDDEDEDAVDEVEDEIWETVNPKTTLQRVELYRDEEEDAVEESAGPFDDPPSESHTRRSEAARRTWSDPEWREKWYQARWGDKVIKSRRRHEVEDRLRALQPESFLSNEAVVNMTEDEIAEAIRTYVSSRKKRSASRQLSTKNRKKAKLEPLADTKQLSRNALLGEDPKVLQEAREQRAERAVQAYRTRLGNQSATKRRRKSVPTSTGRLESPAATPLEARNRIEAFLNNNRTPDASDLELLLQPTKLARRKDVLRRILSECFDLRGKCVPVALEQAHSDVTFVTQTPVDHLGAFCLHLIRQTGKRE